MNIYLYHEFILYLAHLSYCYNANVSTSQACGFRLLYVIVNWGGGFLIITTITNCVNTRVLSFVFLSHW